MLAAIMASSELSTSLKSIISFGTPLLVLLMGIITLGHVINRRYLHAVITTGAGAVAILLMNGLSGGLVDFVRSFGDFMTRALGGEPKEPTVPAPVTEQSKPTPNSEAVHVPWEILGFVFVSLIVLAVVGVAVFIALKTYKKHLSARNENLAGWTKTMHRHSEIRTQWLAYETDMVKIIDYPMMSDMKEPLTSKVHQALRNAKLLEPAKASVMSGTPVAGSPFAKAVNELDVAFEAAEREAKKVQWSRFTEEERKNLSRAKSLLAMAMDESSSPSERQVAYKRVLKELQGLVHIPKQALLAIEAISLGELEGSAV